MKPAIIGCRLFNNYLKGENRGTWNSIQGALNLKKI